MALIHKKPGKQWDLIGDDPDLQNTGKNKSHRPYGKQCFLPWTSLFYSSDVWNMYSLGVLCQLFIKHFPILTHTSWKCWHVCDKLGLYIYQKDR